MFLKSDLQFQNKNESSWDHGRDFLKGKNERGSTKHFLAAGQA